ncbi:glycerophosphodiester phosphodiesterase, partial [Francisella tularensis subsp. holarctica]|nr:glycerophosphodiester phosphodiesterase [Francisella tularensis subsp. holarctica]
MNMFKKINATALTVCSISIATADVINIYAHRGYIHIAPENTQHAYTEAMRLGVDVLDMDIN